MFLFPAATMAYCAAPVTADSGTYRYNPKGKPDPFKPFIEIVDEDNKTEKTQKIGEQNKPVLLSPLQRFSTKKFRLTGIVLTSTRSAAMVETPEGKRYILHTGTPIGINNGRVIAILPDSVVVLEKIQDFEGNMHQERVILMLKQNGGTP